MNRIIGLVLLAVGVILAILGLRESDSFASEVSEFFSGNPTDRSIWLMIGGAVAFVAGLGMLSYAPRRP
jgi:hypothetical protein